MENSYSRRRMLQLTGSGLLMGAMPSVVKGLSVEPQIARSPVNYKGPAPICLFIDDGSPVDPLFYEIPGYETPLLIPHEFTRRVADTFDKYDIRGKLTLIPMPSCLGRIDKSLKKVPQDHLLEFLRLVRERIATRFDMTPEYLTHLNAYNLKTGGYMHIYEDAWITQAQPDEIVEYFTLAFQILSNVGMEPKGITCPWVSGIDVEKKFAKALGDAQWNLYKRNLTWYFLHFSEDTEKPVPMSVEYDDTERNQKVVSIPANAGDTFWSMEIADEKGRVDFIKNGIDRLVSQDGKTGRIKDLIDGGYPAVIVTHWQSLFTQGTELGLQGLATLAERIQKAFGSSVQWVTPSEMAAQFVG
ncbi:MAG TPA: hypothetical protein VK179_07255 [Bacteroidales bacterium]|nr:hypothetical protein [Bacteroidales bacterium]